MTKADVKFCMAFSVCITIQKNMMGEMPGKVMEKNRLMLLAPSIFADSYSELGTCLRAARMLTASSAPVASMPFRPALRAARSSSTRLWQIKLALI